MPLRVRPPYGPLSDDRTAGCLTITQSVCLTIAPPAAAAAALPEPLPLCLTIVQPACLTVMSPGVWRACHPWGYVQYRIRHAGSWAAISCSNQPRSSAMMPAG